MKGTKQTLVLGAATILVVAAAWWFSHSQRPERELNEKGNALFPELSSHLDDVNELDIVLGGNEPLVTLQHKDNAWLVAEKHGYPADTGTVNRLLLALGDARVMEPKTSKPEYFERLGVRDISDKESKGAQVTVKGAGSTPLAVIVGDTATQRNGATYVRRAGENQSYLVSGSIQIDKSASQWLDRDLTDIPADQIQSLVLRQPDGGAVEISKSEQSQTDFGVAKVPTGRELVSQSTVNSLASALDGLRLDDVQNQDDFDPGDTKPVDATYREFNGVVIETKVYQMDGENWASFAANFDEALARRFPPKTAEADKPSSKGEPAGADKSETHSDTDAASPPEKGAGTLEASSEDEEKAPQNPAAAEQKRLDDAKAQAAALQVRFGTWVFKLPAYKAQNMTKTMDGLTHKPAATAGKDKKPGS